MRDSEFWRAVTDEFGQAYGEVLTSDVALTEFGGRTARQALADGADQREVWLALCRTQDVPRERWHGVGRPKPRER